MSVWYQAFLLTQIVEAPIYSLALRKKWLFPLVLLAALGASTITHPVVWFGFPRLGISYWWMVVLAELFAVLCEAIYLRLLGVRDALLWSLLANAASAGAGFAIRAIWGW